MGGLTTTTTPRLQALPVPPPTEDSAHSLQSSGVVTPVEVKDRPTSTPTSRIQALLDPTVLVRLGFKVRPLRDGGGKPSPGRQPPPLRKPPPVLVELGKKILALASPWSTKVFDSIHKQEKVHPFPEDLLTNVRALICPASDSSCSPGQPFYLEHIQFLAQLAGDPDADYCTTLKQGVPLGVDTPVLRSPDIWPTKEELKGEISPDPALEAPTGSTHRQKLMLPTSGLHLWRRWPWTCSWDLSLLQKQLHIATAWFQSYARGQWRPLTKGTRSGLSMMAHGEEPMPTYRHIVRSAPQPPRCWTVCMVFTGSKLPRLNPQEENSPMLIGSGLRNKRNGCCLRQMSPRLIGESRYPLQSGNTRLLVWEMNGGSTRWAPMAWRAPKSTGAAWQPCYFVWYITYFLLQIGALSLWTTSAGSSGRPWRNL